MGSTTIVIAHRLSTLRDANQIIVFNHGKVAEIGMLADAVLTFLLRYLCLVGIPPASLDCLSITQIGMVRV